MAGMWIPSAIFTVKLFNRRILQKSVDGIYFITIFNSANKSMTLFFGNFYAYECVKKNLRIK